MIVKKVYEDELLKEINKDREKHVKKPLKANEQEELEMYMTAYHYFRHIR